MVSKKSVYGAPVELNYPAMIYSLVARITERIPTIKDLVKHLKNDYIFRLDCGFLLSDSVPSEASYSRMLTKISEKDVLQKINETLLFQVMSEGLVHDQTIAIDTTHIEAKDQPPSKEETKPKPKKRGRKSTVEHERWLKEKTE